MEKFILTCAECGHVEEGSARRAFMLKVRMLNHVTREHPELALQFKDVIDERSEELSAQN